MSSGLISEHGSIVLQLKSHQIFTTTKKKPLMETSHFILPINTHFPKSNLLIENRISDSGYSKFSRFRTKATSNNGSVMAAETDELSFYQLLGISESGSFSEIKHAYKQLARKYHPDVSPPDRTEENTKRFILVQEAYETLSDPTRRAMYDRDLARGLHLAFSASKRYYHPHGHHNQEGLDEKTEWKNRWQTQLSGLKMKSKNRDSNMSWAALMRKQRNKESSEV